MLIRILFLPAMNWLHKLHHEMPDVLTAGLQSSSGQTSVREANSQTEANQVGRKRNSININTVVLPRQQSGRSPM